MSTYNTAGSGDTGMDKFSKGKTLPVLQQPTLASGGHVGDSTRVTIVYYDDGAAIPVT